MSFFGDVWGGVKKVAGNVGSTVKKAVVDTGHEIGRAQNKDWVKALEAAGLAATGFGAPAAAALIGGGSLLGGAIAPGGNLGTAIGQGAKGAAIGGAAGALGSTLRGGGSLLGKAGSVLGAGKGVLGSALGAGGSALRAIPGLASGALGGAGSGTGGGSINPTILALAGLQTANAASLGKTANDFSDKAWSGANDSYTERAGLRSGGINRMTAPVSTAQPALSAIRANNPYARPQPLPLAGGA